MFLKRWVDADAEHEKKLLLSNQKWSAVLMRIQTWLVVFMRNDTSFTVYYVLKVQVYDNVPSGREVLNYKFESKDA